MIYGIQGALRVRSVVLFQASYHQGRTALMEKPGELGRRHLSFWSSAQAINQQLRALQSIVFDTIELTLVVSSTALVQACERSILLTGTSSIIEMFSRGSGRATCVSCVEVICRVRLHTCLHKLYLPAYNCTFSYIGSGFYTDA